MASVSEAASDKAPVEISKGINGLEKVILRVRGSSAEIYLYGAHVASWKNEHGEELLFVSSKAIFKPPKPIRGGIPICFPQFSNHGPLEPHGFARNRFWSIDPSPPPFPTSSVNKTYVDLILKPTEEDFKIWPHSFEFRLRVTLGPAGDLMLTSRIRNTNADGKPFSFTFAYHTYFSVSDISEVRVEGLETLDYLDNLQNKERFTEQGDAITFESEVDKVYLSTPTKIAILDHEKKRTFVIRKDGLPDAVTFGASVLDYSDEEDKASLPNRKRFDVAQKRYLIDDKGQSFPSSCEIDDSEFDLVLEVVWNPWDKKAKAIPDLGDENYKHMLCVESAAVEKSITLKPGEEWRGRQELSAVPSSYFSGQLDPQRVIQGN